MKVCATQEECPLLCEAIERKVKAERDLRLVQHEFSVKRNVMNRLYLSVTSARAAQIKYFRSKNPNDLVQAKAREAELDEILKEIRQMAQPSGTLVDDYIEGGK